MSEGRQRVIYRDEGVTPPEDALEFRLTYEGELLSTRTWVEPAKCPTCGSVGECSAHGPITPVAGPSPSFHKAQHKHKIRKAFHPQLRAMWKARNPSAWSVDPVPQGTSELERRARAHTAAGGIFRWYPILTSPTFNCSLEILFLRHQGRGAVLSGADIDNRVKTLIDALKMPAPQEMDPAALPDADEDPFFVLLVDDKLVTHLSVECDDLLQPTGTAPLADDARVVIRVKSWTP